ncbi:hypothetical protein QBC39DRAFT_364639 [Podospora conica]|nr:hypothetical protein QBC39DRAFT_364639 [Schizothecium conicum]
MTQTRSTGIICHIATPSSISIGASNSIKTPTTPRARSSIDDDDDEPNHFRHVFHPLRARRWPRRVSSASASAMPSIRRVSSHSPDNASNTIASDVAVINSSSCSLLWGQQDEDPDALNWHHLPHGDALDHFHRRQEFHQDSDNAPSAFKHRRRRRRARSSIDDDGDEPNHFRHVFHALGTPRRWPRRVPFDLWPRRQQSQRDTTATTRLPRRPATSAPKPTRQR